MVEMAMQQLAAASPKVMSQRPELKFVNEQGETDRQRQGPTRLQTDCRLQITDNR